MADKHNVQKYMKFGHQCMEGRWNEATSKWHVTIKDLSTNTTFEDVADVFVTGSGALNQWKWPDIAGLHDYRGQLMHSANWDDSFNFKGKTIAVLGAGSSGIQIVPSLAPHVEKMDHYVRGRTWISATFGQDLVRERNDGADGNFTYAESEKQAWRENPESYIKYRKLLEIGMQGGYAVTHRGTTAHTEARKLFDADMRNRLSAKPEIIDHLLPDFPPLCKRLTPGPGYLEALTSSKVNVIPTQISHIDATGITTTDGQHRAVDAIVCATGFNTSFSGRFPVYGLNGSNLQTRYTTRPETYLSLAVDDFPNYFQSLGPNSGLGNGNLLIIIESIQLYIAQLLRKLSTGNVRTLQPKKQCVQNFTNYCDAYFARTVFSAECGSWYKSSPPNATAEERKRGRVTALWPGSSVHAVKALESVRWEDWEMELRDGNEMGWFGDGWAAAERDEGDVEREGICWYLNDGMGFVDEAGKQDGVKKMNGVNGVDEEAKAPEGDITTHASSLVEAGHVTV